MSRFDGIATCLEFTTHIVRARGQKIGKRVNGDRAHGLGFVRDLFRTVHDQCFQFGKFVANAVEFGKLVDTVATGKGVRNIAFFSVHLHLHNHLGLGMLGNIETSLRIIGSINTRGNSSGQNASKVGKQPFGSVEPDNVDDIKLVEAQLQESLSKGIGAGAVLLPSPGSVGNIRCLFALCNSEVRIVICK